MAKEQPTIEQLSERLIDAKKKHAATQAAAEASLRLHERCRAEHDTATKALSEADKALTVALATAAHETVAAASTSTSTALATV